MVMCTKCALGLVPGGQLPVASSVFSRMSEGGLIETADQWVESEQQKGFQGRISGNPDNRRIEISPSPGQYT